MFYYWYVITVTTVIVWEHVTLNVSWYPARRLILDLFWGLLLNDIKTNSVYPLHITNLFLLFAYLCKDLCFTSTKFIETLWDFEAICGFLFFCLLRKNKQFSVPFWCSYTHSVNVQSCQYGSCCLFSTFCAPLWLSSHSHLGQV